ncbi:MAG: hypothetical protein IJ225_05835 [Solobacterium sp.]|nr:hypothetical protein [Solobacterium sp.]
MDDETPKTAMEFKRECRKYFYYLADIKNLMLDIRRVDHTMQGVHSLDFEKVKSSTKKNFRQSGIVKYIDINDELKRQLKEKEDKLLYIIDTIDRIEQPAFRPIIWMLYVQGFRIAEVADLYGMSKDYLSQLINEQIHNLFPSEKSSSEETN